MTAVAVQTPWPQVIQAALRLFAVDHHLEKQPDWKQRRRWNALSELQRQAYVGRASGILQASRG